MFIITFYAIFNIDCSWENPRVITAGVVTKGAIKGAITIAISKNIRVSCIVMSVAKLITFVFLIKNDFIIVSKIT